MRRWLIAVTLFLVAAGCGGRNKPVAVEGTVLLNGEPVEGATVTFLREGGGGRPASAVTDGSGNFQLTTFEEGDGVLPGSYRVLVQKAEGLGTEPEAVGDAQYVKDHYARRLKLRKNKSLLPARYADESQTPLRCTVPPGERVTLALQST